MLLDIPADECRSDPVDARTALLVFKESLENWPEALQGWDAGRTKD